MCDRFASSIAGDGALTQHRSEVYAGDISHSNGNPLRGGRDHQLFNPRDVGQPGFPADQHRFTAPHDRAAAGRRVVLLEGHHQVPDRDVARSKRVRLHLDLEGLELATERVHLDDSRYRAELVGEKPVERGPKLHRRVPITHQLELEDLAQARAHRAEDRRPEALRDPLPRLDQALGDQLARPK